jgi:peptide subunit release factor 1 (eRF1)
MIRHRDVEQLQSLSQAPGKTLTLYLDVDQNNAANRKRQFEVRLRDMLRQLRSEHQEEEQLVQACSEIEAAVRGIEPAGKTLVAARHPGLGITFQTVLKVPVPTSAHWANGAFVRPLLEALDEHERFGIVLVDSQRARIFTVFMGEIEEHKDLISAVSPRVDAPPSDRQRSQARMERRHDENVASHLRMVAGELGRLLDQLEVDRLIIGGAVEAASELSRSIPKRFRGRLLELLPMPITATSEELLRRTTDVQARLERAEELEIVRDLLKEVRKGGRAVAGLPATLEAINHGRVWKLVYVQGLALEGGHCISCRVLTDPADELCPLCGTALAQEPLLVNRMSEAVIERGGHVEVVHGPAAETMKQIGEVAAVLHT